MNELKEDINLYNGLIEDFKMLDSSDYTTAYTLSQLALVLADRWNEIMLDSAKYSKDYGKTKSEFLTYCYQKYKILIKVHDFCRVVYRQGSYEMKGYDNYLGGLND